MAIHTSEPLESAGTPVTNAGRASSGRNVDIFRGPTVMAADESSGFRGDVCGLEQKRTASGGDDPAFGRC